MEKIITIKLSKNKKDLEKVFSKLSDLGFRRYTLQSYTLKEFIDMYLDEKYKYLEINCRTKIFRGIGWPFAKTISDINELEDYLKPQPKTYIRGM